MIRDDYYPNAIQWVTDEEVNVDICKSYPNVLLNNGLEILIYSIRGELKEFKVVLRPKK